MFILNQIDVNKQLTKVKLVHYYTGPIRHVKMLKVTIVIQQ